MQQLKDNYMRNFLIMCALFTLFLFSQGCSPDGKLRVQVDGGGDVTDDGGLQFLEYDRTDALVGNRHVLQGDTDNLPTVSSGNMRFEKDLNGSGGIVFTFARLSEPLSLLLDTAPVLSTNNNNCRVLLALTAESDDSRTFTGNANSTQCVYPNPNVSLKTITLVQSVRYPHHFEGNVVMTNTYSGTPLDDTFVFEASY